MTKVPCSWEPKKKSAWRPGYNLLVIFESLNSFVTNVIRVKPRKPRLKTPSGLLFGERDRTFQPWGMEFLGLLQMTLYFTWLLQSPLWWMANAALKNTDVFQDLDRMVPFILWLESSSTRSEDGYWGPVKCKRLGQFLWIKSIQRLPLRRLESNGRARHKYSTSWEL